MINLIWIFLILFDFSPSLPFSTDIMIELDKAIDRIRTARGLHTKTFEDLVGDTSTEAETGTAQSNTLTKPESRGRTIEERSFRV